MAYVEYEVKQKFALNDADMSDDPNAFADAGYVLNDNDYIIDIDDLSKETIKKLIFEFDIQTQIVWTERGAHFYFKKPDGFTRGANRVSPLGFPYEIKHIGNTKSVTIKRNGVMREIENEGIREEAPFIFASNKKYEMLLGKDEGDGRNNSLFRLRSKIGEYKDWRKVLRFVNNHIFETPLDEKEFEILTREMYVEAAENNEYEVANWLLTELDFLEYGTEYYFKHEGVYTFNKSILHKEVYKRVGNQKTRYVDEVVKQMQYRSRIIDPETIFPIRFTNGYLEDGKFVDINIDDFTPYVIDVKYDPDAKPVKEVDDYLNHLTGSNPEYIQLLKEILGHTLVVDPEFKRMLAKFFIFVGDGGNGKGTLLQIIKEILGTNNVTGMGIKELSNEKYLPSFKGKLANLGDDIQDQSINDKDMKILKNISTCDYISTRELYSGAEDVFFTGSLIFTSNHILKSWEKGESYKRRVVWLPMYGKVKKKDPLFITKLTTDEALEYWIRLIIEGYMSLYENGGFTEVDVIKRFNDEYHEENNPTLDFLRGKDKDHFLGQPVRDIFDQFKIWWEANYDDDRKKANTNMLIDTIEEEFGLVASNVWDNKAKENRRCFVRRDDGAEEFVRELKRLEIIDKPVSDIYNNYNEWASENYIKTTNTESVRKVIEEYYGLITKNKWNSALSKTVRSFVEP